MSSPPIQANEPPRRPTVFISYASEDRASIRLLRDALDAAGLDVWYDESDLGGGDAWDQKIRRQIRDCDYFMPVISATTEQRKEGYFRREWRLATERSLDMADDVLFLIPVTIDGTSENGARVPDKFLAVQWLRLPGGQPAPALHHLVRRILSGDHHALTRPPMAYNRPPPAVAPAPSSASEPPPLRATPTGSGRDDGPPPMPPFPNLSPTHTPGDRFRFFAEVLWWVITAGWLLFKRAPRWARVLLTLWFIFWFIGRCSADNNSHDNRSSAPQSSRADKAAASKAIKATAEKIARAAKAGDQAGNAGKLAQLGAVIARDVASEWADADNTDKQIVAVPFALGVASESDAKFLAAVFTPLYGRLAIERAGETGVVSQPLPAANDEALVALGQKLDAGYVLGAWITRIGDAATLSVRLMKIKDASVAWTVQYPLTDSDPLALSDQIANAVLAAVPKY